MKANSIAASEWWDASVGEAPSDAPISPFAYWTKHVGSPFFVYFIRQYDVADGDYSEGYGPVKIGQARNPYGRRDELQCGNPDGLRVECVILAAADTENFLHRHFVQFRRMTGEWFDHPEVIIAIAEYIAADQIREHQAGSPVAWIASELPKFGVQADRAQGAA